MKSLIWIWLALLAGAGISFILNIDTGYVLLSWDVYSLEMTMALFVLALLGLLAAVYFLVRFLVRLFRVPRDLGELKRRRSAKRAHRALTGGLIALSEGDWPVAEKQLLKHAESSDTPLLNYLLAARAAQMQKAYARRDEYLRLGHERMPSADVAVSLNHAELQLADEQTEQALATLKKLRKLAPRHTHVLRLMRRLYEQTGDWDQLRLLLPQLRKRRVSSAEDLESLETRVHRNLLEKASLIDDPKELSKAWNMVPKALRMHKDLLSDYVSYLLERHQDKLAEHLLREALNKRWNDEWIELYGRLDTEKPSRQLAFAEQLLMRRPEDAMLLLTLGRLSLRLQLWGKARGYLDACIRAQGPVEAFRELGNLLEQMGEPQSALECYRQGVALETEVEPVQLPSPIQVPAVTKANADPDIEPPPPHGAAKMAGPAMG